MSNHVYHHKELLVTFLFPYVSHLPSSLDLCSFVLISTCTWIQKTALKSNQVKLSVKEKKYQVPRFLANGDEQYTLLMFLFTSVFLKYENLVYVLSVYANISTWVFSDYAAVCFVWVPVSILGQECRMLFITFTLY